MPLIAAKIFGSKGAFPSTPLMFEMCFTSVGTRLCRPRAEAEEGEGLKMADWSRGCDVK